MGFQTILFIFIFVFASVQSRNLARTRKVVAQNKDINDGNTINRSKLETVFIKDNGFKVEFFPHGDNGPKRSNRIVHGDLKPNHKPFNEVVHGHNEGQSQKM